MTNKSVHTSHHTHEYRLHTRSRAPTYDTQADILHVFRDLLLCINTCAVILFRLDLQAFSVLFHLPVVDASDGTGLSEQVKSSPFMLCLTFCYRKMIMCMRKQCGKEFDHTSRRYCEDERDECVLVCQKNYEIEVM